MSLQTLTAEHQLHLESSEILYLPYYLETLESARFDPLWRITGAHLICLGGALPPSGEDVHSGEHRLSLTYPENELQYHETGIGAKGN